MKTSKVRALLSLNHNSLEGSVAAIASAIFAHKEAQDAEDNFHLTEGAILEHIKEEAKSIASNAEGIIRSVDQRLRELETDDAI